MKKILAFMAAMAIIVSASAKQTLGVPTVLSDGTLLQRNTQVNLWGWAKPGKPVNVTVSWNDGNYSTKAGKDGKWILKVPTGEAATEQSFVITSGSESLTVKHVSLGELWICSGQSNMQFSVKRSSDCLGYLTSPNENISLFNSGRISSYTPLDDIPECDWGISDVENTQDFSAVGYCFGDKIQKALNCPVGLMCLSFGGTPVEAWTPDDFVTPEIESINKRLVPDAMRNDPNKQNKVARLIPSSEWNANINPVMNMTVAGVIWYQGEHNVSYSPKEYGGMLENMINAWRSKFCDTDMPFYIVQLVPHTYAYPNGALVREGQEKVARKMKNVEIVGTMDLTDRFGDIHPRNKKEVGNRLANAALATKYGQDVVYKMPCFKSASIEGNKVVVTFDNVTGNLECSDDSGRIDGFQIAEESNAETGKCTFRPANVKLVGNQAILSAKNMENPAYVRYCFGEYPGKVHDGNNLPLLPFRTDNNDKAKPARDFVDGVTNPAVVQVSGKDLDTEVQQFGQNVKYWTNRPYTNADRLKKFEVCQIIATTWKEKDETSEPIEITVVEGGRLYLVVKSLSYMYKQLPDWTVLPSSAIRFKDAKGNVKTKSGNINFMYIAYLDVKAGQKITVPGDRNNPAGACVMAKQIIKK